MTEEIVSVEQLRAMRDRINNELAEKDAVEAQGRFEKKIRNVSDVEFETIKGQLKIDTYED